VQLLERWRYLEVDAWRLTSKGDLLARLYHESDLLAAEALSQGIFDRLDAPTLAAVVSGCTFEARKGRRRTPPRPPREARPRLDALWGLWDRLHAEEERARLWRTRAPDPGFAEAAWRWARGEGLVRVLEHGELAAGDFVRNAKQLIDLLSQIAILAPEPSTAAVAANAARKLTRGVVAASLWPARAEPLEEPSEPETPASAHRLPGGPGGTGSALAGQTRP
jgi:ATP-dependent RNA helicase HelY